MTLNKHELAVRRWHAAMRGRYGHDRPLADLMDESGAMLQCWRDIDLLISRLDLMQSLVRDMELAADDKQKTESLSAVHRPRPPTNDDTIAFDWKTPSEALTPIKAMPAEHPSLPAAPALPALPTVPGPSLLNELELWNAVVTQAEMLAETIMSQCITQSVHLYDAKRRIVTGLRGLRKAVPPEQLPIDEGYSL